MGASIVSNPATVTMERAYCNTPGCVDQELVEDKDALDMGQVPHLHKYTCPNCSTVYWETKGYPRKVITD